MQLKRKIFHDCIGSPKAQKAVALALLLKRRLGRTSTLHNWSVNKLHDVAGVSASTIKKYLPVMRQMGWVHFSGKHNQHLVVSKLASHTEGRNIRVDAFCFDSFKDIFNSLRAFMALAIQHRKDFIRRTIQTYHDPLSYRELIRARKTLKRLVKRGVLKGVDDVYKELGLSYKRIARETGNCIRTAQRIIGYATKKGWCFKKHNYIKHYLKGIGFREGGEFFSFSTGNYIYEKKPNTYTLNFTVSVSLSNGINRW